MGRCRWSVAARDHLFFPEQLTDGVQHHRPGTLLLWPPTVRITAKTWMGFRGLQGGGPARTLQPGTTTMDGAGQTGRATESFRSEIHARARAAGRPVGLGAAEEFKRITP